MGRPKPHIVKALLPLAVPIESVRADPANARRHSERNIGSISASLQRYGQRRPVVVNRRTGTIEAGNATWEAAKALGWSALAVVYVDDDPSTAAGFAIADNRTAELAEWDDETLARTLEALKTAGELPHVGFDDSALDALLRAAARPRPSDDTVEGSSPVSVRRGQMWALGRHRLMCGEAPGDFSVLCRNETIDGVVTDPPL